MLGYLSVSATLGEGLLALRALFVIGFWLGRRELVWFMIRHVAQLWSISALIFEGRGMVCITRRLKFFAKALVSYRLVKPLLEAPRESPLGELMASRPETIGAVVWPYQ